jgi:hypothetical protein
MRKAIEKVFQALHEDPKSYIPTSERVRAIAQKVAPEEDPKALAKEVLREARRRVKRAVKGLWDSLGIRLPPLPEVEKLLWRGDAVEMWRTKDPPGYTKLDMGKKGTLLLPLLPFSLNIAPKLSLEGSKAGDVVLSTTAWYTFFAQEGRAFLSANALGKVEEVCGVARAFSPLLQVFGLEGLEEALEELKELKEGEVRVKEGRYVLARRKNLWTLLFGTLFGSSALNAAFVLEEEMVFSYPQGLEISLRGSLHERRVDRCEVEVRWEGEVARGVEWYPGVELTDRGFPQALVLKTVKKWLGNRSAAPQSPRIRALLQELSEREDPLEAPKEPGFFQKVRLRALSQL